MTKAAGIPGEAAMPPAGIRRCVPTHRAVVPRVGGIAPIMCPNRPAPDVRARKPGVSNYIRHVDTCEHVGAEPRTARDDR